MASVGVCKLTICPAVFFFFQAEDGIRDLTVTGVQTCALPIYFRSRLGDGRKRGGATKARHARKVQRLMYVSLADVFVHRVVGNKNDTVLPGLGEIGRAHV